MKMFQKGSYVTENIVLINKPFTYEAAHFMKKSEDDNQSWVKQNGAVVLYPGLNFFFQHPSNFFKHPVMPRNAWWNEIAKVEMIGMKHVSSGFV